MEKIKVVFQDGQVGLEGAFEWEYLELFVIVLVEHHWVEQYTVERQNPLLPCVSSSGSAALPFPGGSSTQTQMRVVNSHPLTRACSE